MKLWEKGFRIDGEIEKFTVGNDFLLDKALVKYEVLGSLAHAAMLHKIGVLSKQESVKIKKALTEISCLDKSGKFPIAQQDEDVHTAVENFLTKKLGSLGKKIHTARSRNDQVLVDMRLYSKENLLEIKEALAALAATLIAFAEKNKEVPIPGYTHMRKAMPSSVGMLFGAYAESLLDDFKLLDCAYELSDQSPLGSAAGYGVNIGIDREFTASLLGFSKVQNNALYVQNSRGKAESAIVFALSRIMGDIGKMANDLCLFSMDEFGFFSLPDSFTTGSSIMPQKKNPDVFELVRAKASVVEANLFKISSIVSKLPSGYNRDFQLTKEPLMESFTIALPSIMIMDTALGGLKINKEKCTNAFDKPLFAADSALELVKKGIPFREAYQKTAESLDAVECPDPIANIKSKKHLGATGNLGLEKAKSELSGIVQSTSKEKSALSSKFAKLLG